LTRLELNLEIVEKRNDVGFHLVALNCCPLLVMTRRTAKVVKNTYCCAAYPMPIEINRKENRETYREGVARIRKKDPSLSTALRVIQHQFFLSFASPFKRLNIELRMT